MIQYQGVIVLNNDKELIIAMGDLDNGYCYSDINILKKDIQSHAYREGVKIIKNNNLNWNNIEVEDIRTGDIATTIKSYSIRRREVSEWARL